MQFMEVMDRWIFSEDREGRKRKHKIKPECLTILKYYRPLAGLIETDALMASGDRIQITSKLLFEARRAS